MADEMADIERNINITDLPVGFVVDVASYLSKPSRGMFAVAMAMTSYSRSVRYPSTSTKEIVCQEDWTALDLKGIEDTYLGKYETIHDDAIIYRAKFPFEDDIALIISCIDESKTLKTLKLTSCVNMLGHALIRLGDTVYLEQIDLSMCLVKQAQQEDSASQGSKRRKNTSVISELNGILSTRGSSLRLVAAELTALNAAYGDNIPRDAKKNTVRILVLRKMKKGTSTIVEAAGKCIAVSMAML